MWIYIEHKMISRIIEVLQKADETEAISVLDRRMRQELQQTQINGAYRDAAHRLYHDEGTLEFDQCAVVSKGYDAGAYVMGWRWVADDEVVFKP